MASKPKLGRGRPSTATARKAARRRQRIDRKAGDLFEHRYLFVRHDLPPLSGILVEDKRATPADLAASRIDFPAWLKTLSQRDRRIALKLSQGESTSRVARQFRLSVGRVSQLRGELSQPRRFGVFGVGVRIGFGW